MTPGTDLDPATERRSPSSRALVLQAAVELADREGLDAVTMRRRGKELGVEAADHVDASAAADAPTGGTGPPHDG